VALADVGRAEADLPPARVRLGRPPGDRERALQPVDLGLDAVGGGGDLLHGPRPRRAGGGDQRLALLLTDLDQFGRRDLGGLDQGAVAALQILEAALGALDVLRGELRVRVLGDLGGVLAAVHRLGLLDTLAHSGARPGEWDALRPEDLDFQGEAIRIERQWNAKLRRITPPKHGHPRTIAMTEPVRERLLALPRESEWLFTTLRGTHYAPSSRSHHWNRVRCAAGLGQVDLYTATRHYFAWYALNVLDLPPHVIALQLGHRDGGGLVRTNYGHPDAAIARERVRQAFAQAPTRPVSLDSRRTG
jgi:Phage integrase family